MNKTKYLKHIEVVKGLAPLTVKNYSHWLTAIEKEIGKPLEKVTLEDVETLVKSFRLRNMVPKTINLHIVCLRTFLKYCNQYGTKTIEPLLIKNMKFSERKIEVLKEDDLKKLITTDFPPKEKAIIEILFSTGLRISELHQLRIENIRLDNQSITVQGKGGKIRLVFFTDKTAESIKNYVKDRKTGYLFPGSIRMLQRIVKEVGEKAGLKSKITPHLIRHMFATNLLENGASIYDAKTLLGHSSIATTERYLHVSDEHLRRQYQKFHGIKNN